MMLGTYKKLKELAESELPDEIDGDYVAEQLEEACNCILRALHELDTQAYLDCVAWDVHRVAPPSTWATK